MLIAAYHKSAFAKANLWKMQNQEYGQMLTELRQRANKTQKEVAEALKVSEQTIRNWEKGRERPRLFIWQVVALCELFSCAVEELPSYLDWTGNN